MGTYERIADLLEYPDERLFERVDACIAALGEHHREGGLVVAFRAEARRLGPERLEELYTSAFDMDADCALYVGHHLFGSDARRGVFMARLAAQYRDAGIAGAAGELPDYLPAVLRYLECASAREAAVCDDLVSAVLRPATRQLAEALDRRQHPYACLMRALAQLLES